MSILSRARALGSTIAVVVSLGVAGCGGGHGLAVPGNLDHAQRAAVLTYAAHQVWLIDGASLTTRHVGCSIDLLGTSHSADRTTAYTATICVKCPHQRDTAAFPMAYDLDGDAVTGASLRTGYDGTEGVDAVRRVFPSRLFYAAIHSPPAHTSDDYYALADGRGHCKAG